MRRSDRNRSRNHRLLGNLARFSRRSSVSIPKSQIDLSKSGDELNIRIGNHRRNLVLPQALAALQPSGAKMEEDYLKIRFAPMD